MMLYIVISVIWCYRIFSSLIIRQQTSRSQLSFQRCRSQGPMSHCATRPSVPADGKATGVQWCCKLQAESGMDLWLFPYRFDHFGIILAISLHLFSNSVWMILFQDEIRRLEGSQAQSIQVQPPSTWKNRSNNMGKGERLMMVDVSMWAIFIIFQAHNVWRC